MTFRTLAAVALAVCVPRAALAEGPAPKQTPPRVTTATPPGTWAEPQQAPETERAPRAPLPDVARSQPEQVSPVARSPQPRPAAAGAPIPPGAPWVESSDPRWSTRRTAQPLPPYEAPDDEPAPAVVYAPAPLPVVYVSPWYGPRYYGPRFYAPRPLVGVGFGVRFGGGFHGGGFHGRR